MLQGILVGGSLDRQDLTGGADHIFGIDDGLLAPDLLQELAPGSDRVLFLLVGDEALGAIQSNLDQCAVIAVNDLGVGAAVKLILNDALGAPNGEAPIGLQLEAAALGSGIGKSLIFLCLAGGQ